MNVRPQHPPAPRLGQRGDSEGAVSPSGLGVRTERLQGPCLLQESKAHTCMCSSLKMKTDFFFLILKILFPILKKKKTHTIQKDTKQNITSPEILSPRDTATLELGIDTFGLYFSRVQHTEARIFKSKCDHTIHAFL